MRKSNSLGNFQRLNFIAISTCKKNQRVLNHVCSYFAIVNKELKRMEVLRILKYLLKRDRITKKVPLSQR